MQIADYFRKLGTARGAVVLVAIVLFGVAGLWHRSNARDFRSMHRSAVASMHEKDLSGTAAAEPFVGMKTEVDCVVGQQMMGFFGGLGVAMHVDDITFVAGPHEDFDVMKWMPFLTEKQGQRVHLSGEIHGTETFGNGWSPLVLAVTGIH